MLCKGDSLGVFQVESRAQMNMLPRLKPRCFYDLVIEVAIVRPGPIQGDMVHPYPQAAAGQGAGHLPLPRARAWPARRAGADPGAHAGRAGVPGAGDEDRARRGASSRPAEANQLRKAMATFRSRGTIDLLQDKMVGRMVERGYDPDFAARCFHQIRGFGEYGFPESHAASFAHLVYVSSWIKWHYPAAFAAALLNSQPMGFYAPAQIVRDAREHGVEVRGVDVNHSALGLRRWKDRRAPASACARSKGCGSMRQRGSSRREATRPMPGSRRCARRSGADVAAIERLAEADAFRSIKLDRRGGVVGCARRSRARPTCRCSPLPRPATKGGRPRSGATAGDAAERACGERLPDRAAVA